jgi:alcohol dehydrogenase YqhD (iron-dependent ADH family)
MNDFDFRMPTRIIFGRKSEDKVASFLANTVSKISLLSMVTARLNRAASMTRWSPCLMSFHQAHHELGGVTPNPDKRFCLKGVSLAQKYHIDGLLAIGGGSVIDVAKSIGVGFITMGILLISIFIRFVRPRPCL